MRLQYVNGPLGIKGAITVVLVHVSSTYYHSYESYRDRYFLGMESPDQSKAGRSIPKVLFNLFSDSIGPDS